MEQKDLSQSSQEQETTTTSSSSTVSNVVGVNKPVGVVAPQKRVVAVATAEVASRPVNGMNQQNPTPNLVQPQIGEGQSRPLQATQNHEPTTNPQPLNRRRTSDSEKRRLIQQQLVLFLHSRNCPRNEDQTNEMCTFPHCRTMKNVLDHLVTCSAGANCTVPYCTSSRQIIMHWRNCVRIDCPVCSPIREMDGNWDLNNNDVARAATRTGIVLNRQKQAMIAIPSIYNQQQQQLSGNSNEASQRGSSLVNDLIRSSNSHVSMRLQGTQEWQLSLTSYLRNHIVQRLVTAIFPNPSPEACLDRRMNNLISFANKIERDIYEMANSRLEYFHLIAEKIHKLQKELEEKRQRHREQQKLRAERQAILNAKNLAASLRKVTKPIGAVKPIRRNFHANGTKMNLISVWVQEVRRFHDMTRNNGQPARNEASETVAQPTEMDQTSTPLEQTLPEPGSSTGPKESTSAPSNDGVQADTSTSNAQPALSEERKSSIKRCIQSLVHAFQCKEGNCEVANCQRMKRVGQHIKTCRRRTNGGCLICKQLVALCCHHARHCQDANCPVPFCSGIKQKLRQLHHRNRRLEPVRLFGSKSVVFKNRRRPS